MSKWIKANMSWREFRDKNLNKVGTRIRVDIDGQIEREFLIGDINKIGGVCDDCMGFEPEDIVIEYCHEK